MQMRSRYAVMDALCQAVSTHLPPCLDGLLDATTRALKEQRLAARSNFEAQGCEDFLRLCSAIRERAIAQTIDAIVELLPAGITPQAVAPSNGSEWQLVDDAEVEEMLEARRLVRQLRETLGTMEWRSCARLNALTGAAAKDRENPLSLEFMIRALQARLHLREQLPAVREHFYKVAAKELGHVLLAYFKQLDSLFGEFQIEPRIDPVVHPAQERQRARAAREPDAPYQAIQHLRAVGSSTTAAAEPGGATNVQNEPPLVDAAVLQRALAQVRQLSTPLQGWSPQSLVQELSAAGAVLSQRQQDDAGVVAELFQYFEQDNIVAKDIKPALRRLMLPVAQAAMLEPAAFADATHPVRATLDKLMRLCDFSEPPNHALESRVQQLIDGIVEDYQGDSSVFMRCNEELEHLLAVQQRAYSNNADRVRQYNRGRDALEHARQQVGRELARLFGSHAPKVLLDWLDVGWREMLVHELIRYGESSAEWLDDLALISQLNTWLQAGSGDAADPVERAYEVEPVLDLLRKRMESFLPGQYRHTPTLKQLQQQLLGEQAAEWVELQALPAEPVVSLEPTQQRWRERVQQLSEGDWLVTQKGQHLQLIWANAASDHYVLVDHQGREAGSFSAKELMEQLSSGWIGTSAPEGQGVIQDHLENIVGKLYRDIAYARSHDELTGLFNRRSFEAAVAQALAGSESSAFIYAHIDQFSVLNSSFGPLAGDTYLKQTASLLASLLPAGATLARIGGVDFAVVLPQAHAAQAQQQAEALRAAIEANPLEWQGHSHGVTMSLGIVLNQDCHDVISLFSDLQIACNTAKEAGRNRVHTYSDEVDGARTGLMAIAGRVDDIVEQGELSLRVQQIAPAQPGSGQLPHYEVLLVMENELKLLDFISAAERYHRMTKVDRWVLKRIFTELAQHPQIWEHCSGLSINLSGSSLNDDKLLEFIEALFEDYGVPAERICFELTETAAVANLTKTADLVRYLQRFGCTFSIDDFGTGFSSYEYLKRLPVDYVKIDGSFVKEIERSPSDLAMVKSINEIAHVLGRKTIAEYVETVSVRQRLAELGIDYVQGYGIEMPRPLAEFLAGCTA